MNQAKILVVDDNAGIRLTLKGILGKRGYRVAAVETGEAAIYTVLKEKFDLILMDIKMPGINGIDTLMWLKMISSGAVVILMTAYAAEADIRRMIQEGAYTVISKPLDLEKLLSMIADRLIRADGAT